MINDTQYDFFGNRLANCYGDGYISIFDISDLNEVINQKKFHAHDGPVWQISWSHPIFGSLLASCGYDRNIIIWKEQQADDWKQKKLFSHHNNSVNSIQWGPHQHGLILAACSSDGDISIIFKNENDQWEYILKTQAHEMGINALVWGTNIKNDQYSLRFVTGSCDTKVKIWTFDILKKEISLFQTLEEHSDWIRDISWNIELNIIATGSEDHLVLLWKVGKDGNFFESHKLDKFEGPIWRIQWSPFGQMLAISAASAQQDNQVNVYKLGEQGECELVQKIQQQQ